MNVSRTPASDRHLSELSNHAATEAMKGAANYFTIVGKGYKVKDYDRACEVVKSKLKDALPQALQDAKEAFYANMGNVGVATFNASMRLAGLEAAKEIVSQGI